MIKRVLTVLLFSVMLTAICAAQAKPLNYVQTGAATQDLESDELVAGHAILPIGQEVKVTNLETGAEATVTITERIGQSNSRIINLSPAAAAAIAMFDDTTQVTIEAILNQDAGTTAAPVAATATAAVTPAATPAPGATVPAAPVAVAPTSATIPAPGVTTPAAPVAAVTPGPTDAPEPVAATSEPAASDTLPPPPVASVPIPAAASPAPSGITPTSEIEPIVPPWEQEPFIPRPIPTDPLLPELAAPWISGIERPRVNGPAQVPAPPAYAPAPTLAPPPPRQGPAVKVIPHMPGARDNTVYRVQVGSFKARINAQEVFDRLLNAGFSPVFEQQGTMTRVLIPWIRGFEMQGVGERLYNAGFREVWLREEY
ncbi:putative lipoprotein, RlpA family [Treponema primitia ZAS-2]|uniref:Putative lipoprotein, RlpA family n=2 Tax=Treponema primitia TaxID=88058 RepID=F5YPM6_TREPZ|nr:putative lipoprotein, RlpA family [Treponema primitia ZAS-2]